MSETNARLAHLLLAAGASVRMGRPKQLLLWKGESLIRWAVRQILEAGTASEIIVVLGANQEQISPELEGLPVKPVFNADWAEGMGSSIRCGMQYLITGEQTRWSGVMISLVDQPFVRAAHFRQLSGEWQQHGRPIAAARYKEIVGVPAIFDRTQFPVLLGLAGQAGARQLLQAAGDLVWPVDLPEAQFDLDTPEDYQRLKG